MANKHYLRTTPHSNKYNYNNSNSNIKEESSAMPWPDVVQNARVCGVMVCSGK